MEKQVVSGLGEIGSPILKLLKKKYLVVGYDIDKKLMNQVYLEKQSDIPTSFLHIAIPFTKKFDKNVKDLVRKFKPNCVVIHSTISPGTTSRLQKQIKIPIIYSATRGIHKRMYSDLKRYTKFFALSPKAPKRKLISKKFSETMKKCGIKTKQMSTPETLELGKIVCDTSYYGWLINYAQISNIIAKNYNVNYDEMWSFSDEIQKYLGNRPKMFPGFIGGHCVIPNLELIHNQTLDLIKNMNDEYAKKIKNAKTINKKYLKK